jgi:hypothetical protein
MAAAQTVTLPGGTFEVNASTNAFIDASKAGWHLLTFENGDVAAVRYNPVNGQFVWGSLTQPTSPIVSVSWLGANVSDIATHISTWWDAAMKTVPGGSQTAIALIASLDNGSLMQGQPVLYSTSGDTVTGTTNVPGSEATSAGINIPGVSSIFGVFASMGFWKGLGLILAGVLIIVFAALELKRYV